jgi:hypothetical protein
MSPANSSVPPLRIVQAALRKTTETLAKELACPTATAPAWSDFEWRAARAVAAMHGVSPLLSTTLRWQGPQEWQRFLQEQRAHTARRHRRIEHLLQLLDARARADGIPAVALKGAALHALGLYSAGERPMADIDLLVRERDVERATHLLEALAFQRSHAYWRHRSFTPVEATTRPGLGEHSDNHIKVELHDRIRENLPVRSAEVSEIVFPPWPHPGLNAYPSIAALMSHLLLHAAGSIASRSLRLLQLHDIALLAGRMTAMDWDEVLHVERHPRTPWWTLPPLLLTDRYYANCIPPRILAALAPHCPWVLRRVIDRQTLSDVSLSFVWIEAFPGIEWAQSLGEVLRYVAKRIRPDAEMMSTRKSTAITEPGLAANPWTHLHQGARILRWATSRPPRPATMYAVRAALAQPDSGIAHGAAR